MLPDGRDKLAFGSELLPHGTLDLLEGIGDAVEGEARSAAGRREEGSVRAGRVRHLGEASRGLFSCQKKRPKSPGKSVC